MIIKLFNGQAGERKKGEMFVFLSDIKKNVYETTKETLMYRSVLWTLWERERVGRFGRMALKHV